jgi:hypothetical protein
VVNKNGAVIASAVTNLDLHDISRAAVTYGAKSLYVVTPLADQKTLVERLITHWTQGAGAIYNPARRKALQLVRVREDLEAVVEDIRRRSDRPLRPKTVVTSAKKRARAIGYHAFRRMLAEGQPYILMLGTAWGLAEELIEVADYTLAPISGPSDYNHLSVRSAASIILDRVMGNRDIA